MTGPAQLPRSGIILVGRKYDWTSPTQTAHGGEEFSLSPEEERRDYAVLLQQPRKLRRKSKVLVTAEAGRRSMTQRHHSSPEIAHAVQQGPQQAEGGATDAREGEDFAMRRDCAVCSLVAVQAEVCERMDSDPDENTKAVQAEVSRPSLAFVEAQASKSFREKDSTTPTEHRARAAKSGELRLDALEVGGARFRADAVEDAGEEVGRRELDCAGGAISRRLEEITTTGAQAACGIGTEHKRGEGKRGVGVIFASDEARATTSMASDPVAETEVEIGAARETGADRAYRS
eukprot:CAMPEP_0174914050 /NCGR_PEP_ID=MMETSP0167-20121228/80643_1 /TAXON_ID=38298 /ORGANISM="Rhodella maculata, Strain CCMP736" /LENGTH=288 /DNA_ID=CAMNT_0016158801 /DNA_START=82 /DNA_END=946 /DNA_ORIENTATION=-